MHICIYVLLSTDNISVKRNHVIVLFIWVACALINAIAPGNFVRHYIFDQTGVHPSEALINAWEMFTNRFQYFFESTNFISIIFIILLFGIIAGKCYGKNDKRYLLVSVLGMLASLVTAFPVALGYGGSSMPNRCMFIIDVALILSVLNFVFSLGISLYTYFEHSDKNIVTATLVLIALSSFFQHGGLLNTVNIQIERQLRNEVYQNYYSSCKDFYDRLETYSEGEDVRISTTEFPQSIPYTHCFFLYEDSSGWVNSAVAEYYNFNSISIYNE